MNVDSANHSFDSSVTTSGIIDVNIVSALAWSLELITDVTSTESDREFDLSKLIASIQLAHWINEFSFPNTEISSSLRVLLPNSYTSLCV